MVTRYLLVLGMAHLLGDFYFQNEKIASAKDKSYKGVLIHSIEYCLTAIFTITPIWSWNLLKVVLILSIMHFIIDSGKYILLIRKIIGKDNKTFIIDQCLHICSIFVVTYFMCVKGLEIKCLPVVSNFFQVFKWNMENLVRWIMAILIIHKPSNILIQNFSQDYRTKEEKLIIKADNKAGRKIGTIERLIMLIFLSVNQYAAIGFVLTAKSIARYDKITKDEKFAEYYLFGTLMSTLCAIVCRVLILGN